MKDMGVISTDKKEIKFYYSSKSSIGKQALGYIESSKKEVLAIDVAKTNITGTQWAELAEKLDVSIEDLLDKEHPDFVNEYGKNQQIKSDEGWLKVLDQMPQLLRFPILVNGDTYRQIKTPSEAKQFLTADSSTERH